MALAASSRARLPLGRNKRLCRMARRETVLISLKQNSKNLRIFVVHSIPFFFCSLDKFLKSMTAQEKAFGTMGWRGWRRSRARKALWRRQNRTINGFGLRSRTMARKNLYWELLTPQSKFNYSYILRGNHWDRVSTWWLGVNFEKVSELLRRSQS